MAIALITAILIVLVDQGSKLLMLRRASGASVVITGQPGVLALSPTLVAPLWIGAASAAIAALILLPGGAPTIVAAGLGLGIGGGFGNVIDRLARGGVVDFIAIGPWPRFNVADAALVAGLGLVAWGVL